MLERSDVDRCEILSRCPLHLLEEAGCRALGFRTVPALPESDRSSNKLSATCFAGTHTEIVGKENVLCRPLFLQELCRWRSHGAGEFLSGSGETAILKRKMWELDYAGLAYDRSRSID